MTTDRAMAIHPMIRQPRDRAGAGPVWSASSTNIELRLTGLPSTREQAGDQCGTGHPTTMAIASRARMRA
jgi:hypothetical protein